MRQTGSHRLAPRLLLALAPLACTPSHHPDPASQIGRASRALTKLSRGADPPFLRNQSSLLVDHLLKDAFTCVPPVHLVLGPPSADAPTREIRGVMPHYGIYDGPMRYRVGIAGGRWLVQLNIALQADASQRRMELPDCALRARLRGPQRCEGTPYPDAPGRHACPASGRFEARASRHNMKALLERWSQEAEGYYNRDAQRYALPLRYDFNFFLVDDDGDARAPIDVRLPLRLSCGRTPYFSAFRSGWPIPIVAHEVGHFLGLLDEYEALSGVFSFYPKTPFAGAETSRMGISMKRHTQLYPLHHYLILRRYHCAQPPKRDAYREVLSGPP